MVKTSYVSAKTRSDFETDVKVSNSGLWAIVIVLGIQASLNDHVRIGFGDLSVGDLRCFSASKATSSMRSSGEHDFVKGLNLRICRNKSSGYGGLLNTKVLHVPQINKQFLNQAILVGRNICNDLVTNAVLCDVYLI